jgi:acetoin utilization deacetylase AcuC-like enzyme
MDVIPLAVFAAPDDDEHRTPSWHPERRDRLGAALRGVDAADIGDAVEWRAPREATTAELARAHDHDYVDALRLYCAEGGGELDPDTVATPGSWGTALRAAGAVLDAIDALRAGECEYAFAANRPPGHHALADQAMGFCLFNNVAVGAAAITAGGDRVAVVDWDVHHGNGTQAIFWDDPNVLYVSTHQSPAYPGTGRITETGGAGAPRSNLNLPFPPGTRGDPLRAAFDEVVAPVMEEFGPDWLIVSAGFDAHRDDPLAALELTAADFADLTRRVMAYVPPGRLLLVLEGGYDLGALTRSVGASLAELAGVSYRPEGASSGRVGEPTVVAAKQQWGLE